MQSDVGAGLSVTWSAFGWFGFWFVCSVDDLVLVPLENLSAASSPDMPLQAVICKLLAKNIRKIHRRPQLYKIRCRALPSFIDEILSKLSRFTQLKLLAWDVGFSHFFFH